MVVQQRKFVVRQLKTTMVNSVQERNSLFRLSRKIIEPTYKGEVDSFQLLIIALYIAKNGREKCNAPYMKTL
jgi:hypothetical protein